MSDMYSMNTYSMKCACGHVMTEDAETRAEAAAKMKEKMNAEGVAAHMAENHPGETVPPVETIHAMIDANMEPKE